MIEIDKIDRAILKILQEDATISISALAERVNLSSTPCWRRIQRLEKEGVIKKRVTLLDPEKINVGVTVFVAIKAQQHNEKWLRKFNDVVTSMSEVVEFYRMSGETDYLLRIVVPDIKSYDAVYKRLIRDMDYLDINSSFAMEQIKLTTALPLDYT
ncbi:Lrp/AsnC family transcriptional regulator [Parapusillimonas granuli]|uniref:Lrp/AsnC family transcriptional regulator n=1 Tax=Parapusillimonas granuli TaxID=380911 RepID=A0A853FUK2_9BURK|nr:Lrp/AsnC family transcriptional regulator [Parapusillimonas granuli]MBB5216138.1 Lrp/AsnC family transcriptional regulator [Parapusillimonas granuli]MEB2400415.1 Lrp/AsnC family transcriptional regulator [Alcaligenaceae bacterium]NYT47819.1 Lrp/AsnC family transcriptional regulator [Parapusillimonas granuli]